ncbi:uncharacterized protein CELE_C45G9.4 [Caenorhabditis elegans]|uniref:Uncharacterized protein C45G9.4 n=1 Tax=Caenorhabditis elegans TaxID=6239 RepID=YQI4_CAEEL|nr:Uncharacterized protein CELE_C45G9.4 [Caenorhabditis elegans]Q09505.1 RecName: Full=Uncharacterized protein C45G9.4 [Caenorhabditis elegans]CCD67392.1 Uncharacterized protein CELE_C45G9.4 [Caenorhabditis elegans]|eukprot:NP_498076.1 Uncharacterized protein CELE_C45G9.4 [Caenorhabditis elegans]
MTTAITPDKKKLVSPKPTKTTSDKSKTKPRRSSKTSKKRKSKKGLFGCCAKKRKTKRSKKSAKRTKRSAPKKAPKKAPMKAPSKPAAIPQQAQASLQKPIQSGIVDADAKAKTVVPRPPTPIPPTGVKPEPAPRSEPLYQPRSVSSTTPRTSATTGTTEQMVTAPATLPPPSAESKHLPQDPPGDASSPRVQRQYTAEKYSKEDQDDDDQKDLRKSVAYPSHKFFMTQYVKDECRVRRWVYEDSVPLMMESNMKHMLRMASNRIAACQSDKATRCDMMKDLNEMTEILDGNF